jgi:hypothetical protein
MTVKINGTTGIEFPDASVQAAATKFTKNFQSAQQTISNAGALTVPHGLGVKPSLVRAILVCTTADGGYSVGDEYDLGVAQSWDAGTAQQKGMGMWSDATNIYSIFANIANPFSIFAKTTGVPTTLTNANWRLIFRAYA